MKLFDFLLFNSNDLKKYWTHRVKQYGKRAVLNLGHSIEEYDKVTQIQKNEIFPYFRKCLKGDETIVLDFGCGPGRFTHDLAQMIRGKAIGIDPILKLMEMAPKYNDVQYLQMENEKIPLLDSSVDIVWVCLVLGGLRNKDLDQAIREIRRVLKTGGLLFLIENTNSKPDAKHWTFRSVAEYQNLFSMPLVKLHDYLDLEEQISIMEGRKL